MKPRNVNVWEWFNCLTKVKLVPGKPAAWYRFRRDEEGFSHEYVTLELSEDGSEVTRQAGRVARDCDGRIEEHHEEWWPIDGEKDKHGSPCWREKRGYRRDHSAEAAGY